MTYAETDSSHQGDPAKRKRLRWRARRGLLENDLILTRFLDRFEHDLSDAQVAALDALLDLPDNTLLDLILQRQEPSGALDSPDIIALLEILRKI